METRRLHHQGCVSFLFILLFGVLPLSQVHAHCEAWLARPVAIEGQAQVMRKDSGAWLALNSGDVFCQGDQARVLANSRLTLEMANQTIARLDEHTVITFVDARASTHSLLDMVRGFVHFISRVPRSLTVETPYMNAAVEGTEFLVGVTDDESSVVVFEGVVAASNALGRIEATAGQTVVAGRGGAPVMRVTVDPWDAVQWALYYPPLLSLSAGDVARTAPEREALQRATVAVQSGETHEALRLLADLEPQSPLLIYRASLFLSVGRVGEARQDIDSVLRQSPDDGNALALKSIIATVQNDRDLAMAAAMEAVGFAPELAAPRLALSYAWQSRFELERAREVLEEGVRRVRDNSLLWARLAEVRLMFREFGGALDAAQTASVLEPRNAYAKTVLGFVELLRMKTKVARQTFQDAIALNPGAPLPRLGYGLALIRDGKLAEGRRQLEIAVTLDPSNALARSYLGKAYYEERRYPLAADQFELAKGLDSNDPTAWLYDAIRKQVDNRLVEALQDIRLSKEKNNNRAVYRSRLLLDEDQASRSANLARIYTEIGFAQLGLLEGYRALSQDPTNYSAHKFLADMYVAMPRHEIARVSELLQSQLLQPVSLASVGAHVAQSSLGYLEGAGPTELGFSEYNSLFLRNGVGADVGVLGGSQGTQGRNFAINSVQDRLSLNASYAYYETDGFRENYDQKFETSSLFGNMRLSHRANVQFEWRSLHRDYGDLAMRFDLDDFGPNTRHVIDDELMRLGFVGDVSPRSKLLVSLIHQETDDLLVDSSVTNVDIEPFPLLVDFHIESPSDMESESVEFQYIFSGRSVDLIAGLGSVDVDEEFSTDILTTITFVGAPFPPDEDLSSDESTSNQEYKNAYVYSISHPINNLSLTLGVSYDDYQASRVSGLGGKNSDKSKRYSPKLGVEWGIGGATTLRMAGFQVIKRPLLGNQTIEPTQIAGFNQFFDDRNGAVSKRLGFGVNHDFDQSLFGGVELTHRDIDDETLIDQQLELNENFHRAYIYWIPSQVVTAGVEYIFDSFSQKRFEFDEPKKLRSHLIPLSVKYTPFSGLIVSASLTGVSQKVEYFEFEGEEEFVTIDLGAGYRFYRRQASFNVEVKNLFDNSFDYQDRNFQLSQDMVSRFIPERQLAFSLVLSL